MPAVALTGSGKIDASPDDFDRMEACCLQAETASSFEAFEHWDGMLHEAIAENAHNSFVSSRAPRFGGGTQGAKSDQCKDPNNRPLA